MPKVKRITEKISSIVEEQEIQKVLEMDARGASNNEIVMELWDASVGGQRWQKATAKLQKVRTYIAQGYQPHDLSSLMVNTSDISQHEIAKVVEMQRDGMSGRKMMQDLWNTPAAGHQFQKDGEKLRRIQAVVALCYQQQVVNAV
jgi:phage terminase large subunit-like protein